MHCPPRGPDETFIIAEVHSFTQRQHLKRDTNGFMQLVIQYIPKMLYHDNIDIQCGLSTLE